MERAAPGDIITQVLRRLREMVYFWVFQHMPRFQLTLFTYMDIWICPPAPAVILAIILTSPDGLSKGLPTRLSQHSSKHLSERHPTWIGRALAM